MADSYLYIDFKKLQYLKIIYRLLILLNTPVYKVDGNSSKISREIQ